MTQARQRRDIALAGGCNGRSAQQGALQIALCRLGFDAAQFAITAMQGYAANATCQCLSTRGQLQLPALRRARCLQAVALLQGSQITGEHGTKAGLQVGKLRHPLKREDARRFAGARNADLPVGNGGGLRIRRAYFAHQGAGIRPPILALDPQRLLQQGRAAQFQERRLAGRWLRQLAQYPGGINAAGRGRAADQQACQQAGQQMSHALGNARNHRN